MPQCCVYYSVSYGDIKFPWFYTSIIKFTEFTETRMNNL